MLVGKYRVERILGQGGMGIVYAATHELLCQKVAVKLLLTADAAQSKDSVTRFLNEARAAARIQNENVARVSDVGVLENGLPYMVMEYLEGTDLSDMLIKRGPLPVEDAIDYVLQALEAIAQAHALGIVHRDLKPANLFLARRVDGSSIVKVLDFGISKATGVLGEASSSNTSTQAMLGSPYYMSPEQLRSSKNVDRRTDIWSVGVILFELLTNKHPYEEETLGALFAAVLEQEPPQLNLLRPDAPPGLDAVYRRCLTRNPDGRFSGAQELAAALEPFCSQRGIASIDRILNMAPSPGAPGGIPVGPNGPVPAGSTTGRGTTGRGTTGRGSTGRGQTAASWGTSGAQTTQPRSRTPALVAMGVIGLAVVGGGIFAARTFMGGSTTATAASGSPATSAAAEAPVAAPTPAPASAAPSASAAPAASAVASAAPSAEPAATETPSAAPVAAAPAVPGRPFAPRAQPQAKPKPSAAPSATPAARGYDPTKDSRR